MVLAIEGSYTNVVGLPLCEVVEVLERLGAVKLFASQAGGGAPVAAVPGP